MLYRLVERLGGVCFNILNVLLAGNLPPFGSVCIVVEEQGRYLALKRPTGKIVFPSGFMRWREHPAETAQREGREETGLELRIGDMFSLYSNPSSRFNRMSTLILCYSGEVVDGELRSSVEGHPVWLDEFEMRNGLDSMYQKILDDYLHYRRGYAEQKVPEGESL